MAVDYTFEDTWTLPGNNGVDGRFHDGAFLAMAGASAAPLTSYRDGVLPSAYATSSYLDLMVVPDSPTPGMAVRCYLGQSVISRAGQGPYVSTLRSTGRADLDASSTTNPRKDLVVAQILDASIGDADTRTRLWRVTGTPGGSPVLPNVPTGAIPLAEVQVAANASQITSSNILDLRRAAGIRGGIRLMLPGDSHSDAGIYPGDARYCRTHQQIEVWKADNVWHGVTPISHTPVRGATPTAAPDTGSPTVMQFVVPDPGFPYYVEASGALTWDQGINTVYYPEIRTSGGNIIARGVSVGAGQPQGTGVNRNGQIPSNRSAVSFTGSVTVNLVMQRDPASSDPAAGVIVYNTPALNHLSVRVVPA